MTITSLTVSTVTYASSATIRNLSVTNLTVSGTLGKVIQISSNTSTTSFSTTANTFQATNLCATMSPASATDKVLVVAVGSMRNQGNAVDMYATLTRAGTNILGANGQFDARGPTATVINPATLFWADSPATTSSTQYCVAIRNGDGATSITWGDASVSEAIFLMEYMP